MKNTPQKRFPSPKKNPPDDSAVATVRQAAERWPSSFVARSKIKEFTGGLISPGTMANHDSAGTGVPGAFRVGRQMCYPCEQLCEWLISRIGGVQ